MANQSASARKSADMQAESPFVLRVSKRLKAPRALVFKMFTDGAHLARWFGPLGHTCTECVIEPKVGGRFYAAIKGSDGILRRVQGIFTDVTPDRRLAFTWAWLDESGKPRDCGAHHSRGHSARRRRHRGGCVARAAPGAPDGVNV